MNDHAPTAQAHDSGHGLAHVMPIPILLAVFVALLILTAITVAVAGFDFGALNLWVAMGVATVKASLVVAYFMHLRYDHPFNAVVFIAALVFVALFLGITLLDTVQYQPDIERFQQEGVPL